MQVFVGRQPILSATNQVVAYDILTDPRDRGSALAQSPTREICRLLLRIGWRVFTSGRSFVIPWDGSMPRDDFPAAFPRGRAILAVRTDRLSPEQIEELLRFRLAGYRILVDDFRARPSDLELLPKADFVRVRFDPDGVDHFFDLADQLAPFRAARIASGVDSLESRKICLASRFLLCQGEWLVTPDPDRAEVAPSNHLVLLRLLSILNDPDVPIEDVEHLVRQDVGLSYRLVRLVNSAGIGLRHRVSSIGQAVMLLGLRHLRSWVSLSTVGLIGNKPRELMVQAMVRAFACEGMAAEIGSQDTDTHFTIGLFSVLDALLDRPMSEIVKDLPLTEDVRAVLAGDEDLLARRILDCAIAHESGDFEAESLLRLPIDPFVITGAYLDALVKTDHVLQGLDEL